MAQVHHSQDVSNEDYKAEKHFFDENAPTVMEWDTIIEEKIVASKWRPELEKVFGALFFILMTVAALTSALGMLEPAVSWLEEHRGFKRASMAIILGVFIWLFGIPALLSFNIWSGFLPLDHVAAFAGKTIFDLMDFLVANIIIPVGGLLLALFAGWAISKESIADELGWSVDSTLFQGWRLLVRYVAPIAIMSIFVFNIAGGGAG